MASNFDIAFLHDAILAPTTPATTATSTIHEEWGPGLDPTLSITWMDLKTIREYNRISVLVFGTFELIMPLTYKGIEIL